jgi:HicB-like protein involved in pilus formation
MDLTPFVDSLRRELAVAADPGDQPARAVAERLTASLESAARLALLEALSAAADEITRELAPGSVDVRLRGRDPDFVVTPPPPERSFEAATTVTAAPAPPAPPEADEGGMARITLRLPEQLKVRIEQAAAQAGLSVNAWLVRAVAGALDPEDRSRQGGREIGQRFTGWSR